MCSIIFQQKQEDTDFIGNIPYLMFLKHPKFSFYCMTNAVIRYTFKTFDLVFGFVKVSLVTLSSLSL